MGRQGQSSMRGAHPIPIMRLSLVALVVIGADARATGRRLIPRAEGIHRSPTAASRQTLFSTRCALRTPSRLQMRVTTSTLDDDVTTSALDDDVTTSTLDDDRVCTICVALLGQYGKVEAMIESGHVRSKQLDLEAFGELVDSLEVQCSEADRRAIFAMIDRDGSSTIDVSELKETLRSSGAITRMYDSSLTSFAWLLAATLAFDGALFLFKGGPAAFDFLTAYAVEDSLSVDNLFVFLLIFRFFKVPPALVDTCLNYGITGSILLRGIFIFLGLAAAKAFEPVLLGFSAFLLFSSYQLLSGSDDDDDDGSLPPAVTGLLARLPLTNTFEGDRLVVPRADGTGVLFTQLTATLVSIALCDVLFAVDSIPAVLACSDDPFVIYSSNIAAVIGLRSLYQLLSVAVSDLVYLEQAVAIVLGFVGLKLAAQVIGVEVGSGFSLGVIASTLCGGVVLSQLAGADKREAHLPTVPHGLFLALGSAFMQLRNAAAMLKRLARSKTK